MHFGFALDLSDIDLLNVDLLDQRYTHLDLFASKTSWRRLEDMSSRRLQDVLWDDFKTFSRPLKDVFARHLQDVLEDEKLLCWRRVEGIFKTCLEDVFKKSWRRTNVCWVPL